LAPVNAAILLARALVHAATAGDAARYTEVVDRARYCQLLASRLRLPLSVAHRVDLGAWLSGLEGQEEAKRRLVQQHHLEPMLYPAEATSSAQSVEAQILSLVRFYQDLRKRDPAIRNAFRTIQKHLDRDWASSPEQRRMTRCFVRVLRDEAFLLRAHPAAGKILIVDPEEAVSPVLAPTLAAEGYDVRVAHDAPAALKMVSQTPPDLIVCDLDLPLVNGIQFCRQIRENPQTARITFVVASDKKSKVTTRNCLREGIDDVLTKPIDQEMLFLRLKRYMARPEAHEGPAVEAHPEGGVAGSLSEMSFADLVQMVTASAKTMTLAVTSKDKKGEVVVVNGEVVHAAVGDQEGEQAFYEMMRWEEGDFVTRHSGECAKRTINAPVMSLLMEGARLADESGAGPS